MRFGCRSRYISRYVNLKFGFLPFVVASIVAMVFLRRICSSRPSDGEQRGQSLAALTAHGRGLNCFQPQPRQPVLRQNKLRIFRFRASTKAQSLRCFSSPHEVSYFVGTPTMAGHCVSKQIGRHDAACQGCPRCVSRSPVLGTPQSRTAVWGAEKQRSD